MAKTKTSDRTTHAPVETSPRPLVKRLNSRPVIIAGAALLGVLLAVVFFVTSRPKEDPQASEAVSTQPPAGPATADFLSSDPGLQATPGPVCQGMECTAAVAAGQASAPEQAAAQSSAPQTVTTLPPQPASAPAPTPAVGPDPYATTYASPGPASSAPPAEGGPSCSRACHYRAARAARLGGDPAAQGTAPPQNAPATAGASNGAAPLGADGMPSDAYYAAMADSMIRAELASYTPAASPHADSSHETPTAHVDSVRAAVKQTPDSTLPAQARKDATPYVVPAGTLISAALVTGVNSDLCGDVKAVVTRPVFDAAQNILLIPAGAQLLGTCDNQVSTGQSRLAVAWTRLRMPDGRNLELPGMRSHSTNGASGVNDRVNNHWGRVFGTAILLSALGAGSQLAIPQTQDQAMSPAQTAATAVASELSSVATEVLRRNMEVKPTIEIRPATPFVVFVSADLDVGTPYGTQAAGL